MVTPRGHSAHEHCWTRGHGDGGDGQVPRAGEGPLSFCRQAGPEESACQTVVSTQEKTGQSPPRDDGVTKAL